MLHFEARQQWLVFGLLAVLMTVTRSHHFATLHFLPDATWAVFFAAGFYVRKVLALPVLLLLAALADALAIFAGGVSAFCVSWAYPFLIPAYAALWFGGQWMARRSKLTGSALIALCLAVALSALVAELVSSGSFYLLSGVVAEPSWAGFGETLRSYFPRSLANTALYLGLIAGLHGVIAVLRQASPLSARP